jgi:amino acid adenylation domain-containing protein
VAPHLAAEGARVDLIVPGERFDRTKDRAWSIRPGHPADLANLLAATGKPAGVLHLWALQGTGGGAPLPADGGATGEGSGVRSLDAFAARYTLAQSTLALLRTLGDNAEAPIRLLLAAADPDLCAAAAADHPHLACRALDLQVPASVDGYDAWTSALAPELAAEALRGEESPVAYRDGRRLVRRPRPAPSPAAGLTDAIGEPGAPVSGHARPNLRNAYVAPEGELERTLAGIWQRLLGIATVGRHDSFFEMGGHSLLATQLMADIRTHHGVALPMAALFENPTVAELAALVARRRREGDLGVPAGAALPEVIPDPERRFEPFPLTDIQQAYWLGRSAAFEMGNIGSYIYQETDFTGLDLGRLETALRRAIDRHGMLRAVILPEGLQRVLPEVPPYRIPVFDLTGLTKAAREEALLAVRNEMSHQVFDVGRWPLLDLRAAVLDSVDGGRIRLFFGIDVLIGDGWSFTLLFRDLAQFYADPTTDLEPLEISFRDYVVAEAAVHETEAYRRSLDYWLGRLADLPGAPELPMTTSPAALDRPHFSRRTARVDAASWKRLKERGSRAGLTPSGLLLAAFSEVLAAWSASPRFTLTLTLFNRPPVHPQIDKLVGDFTSLTLLAVDAGLGGPFETRARAVQERLWQDLEHRAVSGVRVLRELARVQGRQVSLPVIFTSALGLQQDPADHRGEAFSGPADAFPQDAGITSEPVWGVSQTPQVWIDHQVGEHDGELSFNWDVVEDLFPAGLIDAMWSAYRDLLRRLAEDEAAWTAERRRLLPTVQLARRVHAGSAVAPISHDRLHGLFAVQAQRHPDRPAVLAPSRALTYGELFRFSNRLGRHLRELGAKPNTLIAVVQEKGWEQIVSVLGVLASGAAYLPIEPTLPRERIRSLLERAEAAIAVTTPGVDAAIDWPEDLRRVVLDEHLPGDDAPLDPVQRNTDLAYVIFTSGSTGQPKGVMIDHRSAVNTILDVNRTWNVGPDDRVLALSSLSFDLSVWDIFGMLAAGGAIVLPRADAQREPIHWVERLREETVTVWNTVPALLRMLVDVLETAPRDSYESRLRLALLSGDWIPLDLPERVRALSPGTQVVSLGGATEASIWSIWYPIERVDPNWKSIPYGRAMANQTVHVLDDRMEPRPDWVPGHLYIGGVGLAKGYWRDAEKTAASFVSHPETGERLYRTGDLGRALPDGTIELLGREDFQVKVQGYRIELGEIEAALAEHPGVRAAVAAAAGERMGTRRLVAYVVPADTWDGLAESLREHLRGKLPDYMVPAVFVPLTTLPLGPNGKLDRRLLPDPDTILGTGEVQPPQTDTEAALAGIWSEVLRRPQEQIGRASGFFELGGDSLLATQIMSRVREVFGLELPLRTFFDAITLQSQAAAIDRERPQGESDEEKLAKLVGQLQDASPEEVERMLAELRGAG